MVIKKSQISIKVKEQLKKRISKLDYNEQCEIYNLIRKDTDKISENNNGVFINLKYLRDETIEKILDFVKYCENNKKVIKKEEIKQNQELYNSVLNNNTNNNNTNNTTNVASDKSLSDKPDSENLSEGYESYNMDNDYIDDIKIGKTCEDKFSFKSYIDKLSVSSQKNFIEKGTGELSSEKKQIPVIRTKKLKLSGVNARIMKRCRSINKYNYGFKGLETANVKSSTNHVETIISDNISELDKLSNFSDMDNEEQDTESYLDKTSFVSNELTEDLDFMK